MPPGQTNWATVLPISALQNKNKLQANRTVSEYDTLFSSDVFTALDELHFGRWKVSQPSLEPWHQSAWTTFLVSTCMLVISAFHNSLGCKVLEREGPFPLLWIPYSTQLGPSWMQVKCNPAGEGLTFLLGISEYLAHSRQFPSTCRLNPISGCIYHTPFRAILKRWKFPSIKRVSIKMNFNHQTAPHASNLGTNNK